MIGKDLLDLLKKEKVCFGLIDPDKKNVKEAAKVIEKSGFDILLVGGSTGISRDIVDEAILEIRENCNLPIVIFPNSSEAISKHADLVLFITLMNATDVKYVFGEQKKGARLIQKWKPESLPVAYILFSTGKKPTSVEKVVGRDNLDIISNKDVEKSIDYGLCAQFSGKSFIYCDAGSGAEKPISFEIVHALTRIIEIPLVIGGGIRTNMDALTLSRLGVNGIVIGTEIEENPKEMKGIVSAFKTGSLF